MPKHLILVLLALALAACDDVQPPTQIYVVLSPTPETTPASTADDQTPTDTAPAPTMTRPPATTPAPTAPATQAPPVTQQPDLFPTNVAADVQLAEQVFEHGRMFWLRHSRQIWVMQVSADEPSTGDWFCYNDAFQEGEPEIDPALIPPEGMYQPRRGFGKLWRTHLEFKQSLGWAITPEFELTSAYTYIAGGYVQGGQYFPGPGEHRLTTLYNESISFYEGEIRGDCQGGTWRMPIAP